MSSQSAVQPWEGQSQYRRYRQGVSDIVSVIAGDEGVTVRCGRSQFGNLKRGPTGFSGVEGKGAV